MAQLIVTVGSCWLRRGRDGNPRAVMKVSEVRGNWVYSDMDGVDFQERTKYPLHFFDDEDDLGINERIDSVDAGRALIAEALGVILQDGNHNKLVQ